MANGLRLVLSLLLCAHLSTVVPGARSVRILGVFPMAGKSLNILYNRLMTGLADAGHDVTVISAYKNRRPVRNGSIEDVLLTGFAESYERRLDGFTLPDVQEAYTPLETTNSHYILLETNNKTLHHPNVLEFLRQKRHFDLVITEYFWSESILGFGQIFKCPVVVFSSMGGVVPWVHSMMGNHLPVSYVQHYFYLGPFSGTLWQRFRNAAFYLYDQYHLRFVATPDHNKLLRSVFPEARDVRESFYNVSLVLLGTHVSLGQAVPLPPNIVEIGGFHVEPPKPLPDDLQRYLDGATDDGVIYFSMGSHVKSKLFSVEKKRVFLKVFERLKLRVLWKYEDDTLPGKPDNVLIRKWFPQADILAHPKVKLFIGHGGFGSTIETIYHGVPTLMIPLMFDQYSNADRAQLAGYALKLSFNDPEFNEATLFRLVSEMLDNPIYADRARHMSRLFHDRPVKPLDSAIYWIEYVIRHGGAEHLRVAGLKLAWYQYYMMDVVFVALLGFFAMIYVIKRLFKGISNCGIFSSKTSNKEKLN